MRPGSRELLIPAATRHAKAAPFPLLAQRMGLERSPYRGRGGINSNYYADGSDTTSSDSTLAGPTACPRGRPSSDGGAGSPIA